MLGVLQFLEGTNMKTKAIIKANNISKVYKTGAVKTVALDGITFEVEKGEFVAIMGPSGSGKSTLMHIIGALDIPTSGTYILDGDNIENMSDDELSEIRNKKIGFIFQAFNLLARTSALKNVMLPMRYDGVPKEKQVEIAKEKLVMVGLENRMDHTSNQLSGGQQQRVAIARALVMNPSIILADEPTGNIATNQANEIMHIFTQLHKKGHTIVMITHDPEIAGYAQRVIHIRDGKLVNDRKK